MSTIQVFWKDKFGGRAVTIEDSDFDPNIHRRVEDGNWSAPAKPPVIERAKEVVIEEPVAAEEAPAEIKPKRGRK